VSERLTDDEVKATFYNVPMAFGLKAQGHMPTIARMLLAGESWDAIGRAINWCPNTARRHWELSAARAQAGGGLTAEQIEDRAYVCQWLDVYRDNMTLHGCVSGVLSALGSLAAEHANLKEQIAAMSHARTDSISQCKRIDAVLREALNEPGDTKKRPEELAVDLREQLAKVKQALGDFENLAEEHGWSGDPETVLTEFLDSQIRVGWRAKEQLAAKERECVSLSAAVGRAKEWRNEWEWIQWLYDAADETTKSRVSEFIKANANIAPAAEGRTNLTLPNIISKGPE
jgi:hypothetical protein